MKIIDLTHELNSQTPIYPGSCDRQPLFEQSATIDREGYTNFNVTMGMHTGTHIDCPAHMRQKGRTIDKVPLEQLCCRAYVINAKNCAIIDENLIEAIMMPQPASALLIYTGYDMYYGKPEYFTQHPVLTEKAVRSIIAKKFGLIGIDTPSPDRFPFALHKQLFAHNILIIENLTQINNLIGASNTMLYALPLKCKTDSAPARVIAVIP